MRRRRGRWGNTRRASHADQACMTQGRHLFAKADFERLAEQLRHIKGRFLLSINDVPAIREIFTGFQFKEVSLRYSINKEATTEADELLIANYPINIEQAESA